MGPFSFNGKKVLITGASGGLGSALTLRAADQGADLIVTSRSMEALKELISYLPKGTPALPLTADLAVPGQAAELAEKALTEAGRIDVLINNAGLGYFALMEEASEENLRYLFEINTFAPLVLAQIVARQMKEQGGGRIVNIVSAAGRVPIPTVGIYGGAKSALAIMANTMRLEMAPFGVEVINVYPGTTDTSFEENARREESRPGLCPRNKCGRPKFQVADKVMAAATGTPGEVWLEKQGKWLSIASLLMPGYVDRKLSRVRDKVVRKTSLKERRWRLLQMEAAIACNLNCIMCPWTDFRRKAPHKGLMPVEVWEAIRPHLGEVKTIDFTGGGEPLLQPNLVDWVAEATKAGCKSGILTNGLLLDEELARGLIKAGLDWLCVSLDGATKETYEEIRKGSNFDKVTANVKRLASLRNDNVPKTMINFVIMPKTFGQVEQMVHLAAELGVDQLNFKQCDVIRGERGKGLGLFRSHETKETKARQKSLAKARALARKMKIETTAFNFTPSQQPVCDQDPRGSVFVRFDGSVGPCINLAIGGPTTFLGEDVEMPTVHFGRLPESDLAELWETESCSFYRNRFKERVEAFENVYKQSLTGSSSQSPERLAAKAKEAMPEAPEGCRVCHYLYDI